MKTSALQTGALSLIGALSLLHSNSQAREITPEMAEHRPKARMGALPFPGPLFHMIDPEEIGEHSYLAKGDSELSRGIFYTWRGGFLDLSHIRKSIDATAYFCVQIESALREGRPTVGLELREPSIYRLTFNYPDFWTKLSAAEREKLIPEIALKCAGEASYAALTWHEILTWYGYKSTVLVSEKPSAFSYDDVMSHMVGVSVGMKAIADPIREYDEAVTHALAQEIAALGLATPDQAMEAVHLVKNDWWDYGTCRKRFLDIGYDGTPVTPWLTPHPFTKSPKLYTVPALRSIRGHDFSDFLQLEIEPNVPNKNRFLQSLPDSDGKVRVPQDVAVILDAIAQELETQDNHGPSSPSATKPKHAERKRANAGTDPQDASTKKEGSPGAPFHRRPLHLK